MNAVRVVYLCFLLLSKVVCPEFIHSKGILQCDFSKFIDKESPIIAYQCFLGKTEGGKDVYTSEMLPRTADRCVIRSEYSSFQIISNVETC